MPTNGYTGVADFGWLVGGGSGDDGDVTAVVPYNGDQVVDTGDSLIVSSPGTKTITTDRAVNWWIISN